MLRRGLRSSGAGSLCLSPAWADSLAVVQTSRPDCGSSVAVLLDQISDAATPAVVAMLSDPEMYHHSM